MRLLYLANKRLPTEKAYGLQIVAMCEAFFGASFEVELVAPTRQSREGGDVLGYYNVSGFVFTRVWSPDFYWSGAMDKFAFWIKQTLSGMRLVLYSIGSKADVIYSREEEVAIFSAVFSRKVVFEMHSFSSGRRWLYRLLRVLGVNLVCITHALAERMMDLGFSEDNILVAPDGVDLKRFEGLPSKTEARKRVHLPDDIPVVLYAGHLYTWKGADVLAEAAPQINGVVVFVGGTDAGVARFKMRYGTTSNIMFVGHRPHSEIPMWLRAADVLVLPNRGKQDISRLYTSPLKMFEYMASGTPIVATDLPSIREILNESNVVFAEPGESDSLAQAVHTVLNDETSQERAMRARQDVERYSWWARVRSIIDYINSWSG